MQILIPTRAAEHLRVAPSLFSKIYLSHKNLVTTRKGAFNG